MSGDKNQTAHQYSANNISPFSFCSRENMKRTKPCSGFLSLTPPPCCKGYLVQSWQTLLFSPFLLPHAVPHAIKSCSFFFFFLNISFRNILPLTASPSEAESPDPLIVCDKALLEKIPEHFWLFLAFFSAPSLTWYHSSGQEMSPGPPSSAGSLVLT